MSGSSNLLLGEVVGKRLDCTGGALTEADRALELVRMTLVEQSEEDERERSDQESSGSECEYVEEFSHLVS